MIFEVRLHPRNNGSMIAAENVFKQIQSDRMEVIKKLNITSPILTREDLERIENAIAVVCVEKRRTYHYQDLGKAFLVAHFTAAIEKCMEATLNPEEKGLIQDTLGRLSYNPPDGEHIRRSEKALELHRKGYLGYLIFILLKAEVTKFGDILKNIPKGKTSDILRNPYSAVKDALNASNFEQLAKYEQKQVTDSRRNRGFYQIKRDKRLHHKIFDSVDIRA